jgi:two-component system LytT family response regulator
MEIRAIIADDESDSRSVLRNLLRKFCPHIRVEGEANNASKAYDLILKYEPQVVFLDIQMPGGSGFTLLKKQFKRPFDVVFVTGYDQYALEAIKLSALHYLMKPVEIDDLKEAVKRIEANARSKDFNLQLENAEHNLTSIDKKIIVHTKDKVVFLKLDDVTHFEGDRNYTSIFLKDAKFMSSKNLGEYEEMLDGNSQFLRIGKSCMVNIKFITNYSKGDPCMLTINHKYTYEISRLKKQEVLERLKG